MNRTIRACSTGVLVTVLLTSGRAFGQEPNPTAPSAAAAETTPAAPAPAPTPAPASMAPLLPNPGRIPAYVAGGLAVLALGTGAVFGVISLSEHSSFQSTPTTSTANAGESHELIADMCFGGAATLAVASIVMFLTHEEPSQAKAPAQASIVPVVSPRATGLLVRF
jgi:hypothetical protein